MWRRYLLLIISLAVNAMGIVFITLALLGTSPISSVPYVVSHFTPFSFGAWTFVFNLTCVFCEILMMGFAHLKENKRDILLQFPVLLFFSVAIDMWMKVFEGIEFSGYWSQLLLLIGGCVVLATGIAWGVKADIVLNPGEAVVKVLAGKLHWTFGMTKLAFDISMVIISASLSLIFMKSIVGLREGTIVAALLVGPIERLSYPCWKFLDRILPEKNHG